MYRQLGRLDVFEAEYCKARPAAIHRYWFTFAGNDDFVAWLPAFHEQVRHNNSNYRQTQDMDLALCKLIHQMGWVPIV